VVKDIIVLTCSTLNYVSIPNIADFEIYVSVVVNIYCFVFSAIFQKFLFIILAVKAYNEICFLSLFNILRTGHLNLDYIIF